ncbi:hypothetical protein AMECASPLE_000698 [Ameca splendens]|uniref:Secreted protein n=1 Tax=Ameca splendens TaxID=208324 RepID=A0ABV0ZHZ6_9TELE
MQHGGNLVLIFFLLTCGGSFQKGHGGQQPKQRDPDFPLPSHLGQLVRENPKTFSGQPRNIVPSACPASSFGPPPRRPFLLKLINYRTLEFT